MTKVHKNEQAGMQQEFQTSKHTILAVGPEQ